MDINDPKELRRNICNGDVREEIITCYWSRCGLSLSLELPDYIQTTALLINIISTTINVDDDENSSMMKKFMKMIIMLMTLMLMIMVIVMVIDDNSVGWKKWCKNEMMVEMMNMKMVMIKMMLMKKSKVKKKNKDTWNDLAGSGMKSLLKYLPAATNDVKNETMRIPHNTQHLSPSYITHTISENTITNSLNFTSQQVLTDFHPLYWQDKFHLKKKSVIWFTFC